LTNAWALFDRVVTAKVWVPSFCKRGASSPAALGFSASGDFS
jgi:hypothetical protein